MNTNTDVPVVGRQTPNQNEQRALGGFIVESDYDEGDLELIQVEVPVGCQRVAQAFDDDIQVTTTIAEALSPRENLDSLKGFPNQRDLSNRFGFRASAYTTKIDAIIITTDRVYITEIKTRNQQITGLHDVNEGFGQVLMNVDRFQEDYPSAAKEREITGLLLAEDSEVDITLIQDSFRKRNLKFFDPRRGGFVI